MKEYVQLEYLPFNSREEYCKCLRDLSTTEDNPADFVEATVFSKETAVVTVGRFVGHPDPALPVNRLGLWHKPWWYTHVETFLSSSQPGKEIIPLRDYLLRHNRSIFWVVADMIPFGNHWLFRWLLGWLCPPKPAFLKFTTTAAIRKMTFTHQVFQDITLPMTAMEQSIDICEELFDLYPVLIYPCRIYDHQRGPQGQLRAPREADMVPGTRFGMFYDLGTPRSFGSRLRSNANLWCL